MYANFLTEIASHGYLVVAPGSPYNRSRGFSNSQNMAKTIDMAQSWDTGDLGLFIDTKSVAAAGHSCGGQLAISLAARDPRISTFMVFNSATNQTALLDGVQSPSLWIHGGKEDKSEFGNVVLGAEANFRYLRDNKWDLSVFKAVMQTGHLGTFWQPRGGAYAEIAVQWLNMQLKEIEIAKNYFVGGENSGAGLKGWRVDGFNIGGT